MAYLNRKKFFSKRVMAASLGAASLLSFIALYRHETISAIWFIFAALCCYVIGYRFYAAWICARVLVLDPSRATPAERLNDAKDYLPTNKWVVFGHHFAAIAGPGPLIGPTLAAQFGYLPGTMWILAGSVVGGAVQDMTEVPEQPVADVGRCAAHAAQRQPLGRDLLAILRDQRANARHLARVAVA